MAAIPVTCPTAAPTASTSMGSSGCGPWGERPEDGLAPHDQSAKGGIPRFRQGKEVCYDRGSRSPHWNEMVNQVYWSANRLHPRDNDSLVFPRSRRLGN